MLFDIRAPGRRRTIQAVYLFLAVLIGGGLIFFGVGGSGVGLFNADQNGPGGGSGGFGNQIKRVEKQARANPQSAAAWSELARLRFQAAGSDFDQSTGVFTAKGKATLAEASSAWQRHLALNPAKPDANVARLMAQAYSPGGLNQPAKAAQALELVAADAPSAATYSQLALFAFAAGETRKGDLAAAKAVQLAPKAQKKTVKQQLATAKKQGPNALTGGQPPPASG